DASGNWTLRSVTLQGGRYDRVFAKQIDPYGNASVNTVLDSFKVADGAVKTPTLEVATDADGFVYTRTPLLYGRADAGETVAIYAGGTKLASVVTNINGNWLYQSPALTNGSYSFTVVGETANGAASLPSAAAGFTLDGRADDPFRFTFSSFDNVSGGLADRASIEVALQETAARFQAILGGDLDLPILGRVAQLGGAKASAGAFFDPAMQQPGYQVNPILRNPSLNLDVYFAATLSDLAGRLTSNSINTLVHEVLHMLGFNRSDPRFNVHLKEIDGAIYFTGPAAMAVNGGPVRISPEDASHIEDSADVMHPSSGGGRTSAWVSDTLPLEPFSPVDIAILRDLGYVIRNTLVSRDGHTLFPGSQTTAVKGHAGIDTAVYGGSYADYKIEIGKSEATVGELRNAQNIDRLTDIERIRFSDRTIALDLEGNAGDAFRLYQAMLGRAPGAVELGYRIDQLDHGGSLTQVAREFMGDAEFKAIFGAGTDKAALVKLACERILHQTPDKAGLDYWVGQLNANLSVADFFVAMSDSDQHHATVASLIGNGIAYTPYLG
ncbi:MAG TPA: DUF4214 domain-containing protein, partial [Burkholderiaceae bacterium]